MNTDRRLWSIITFLGDMNEGIFPWKVNGEAI